MQPLMRQTEFASQPSIRSHYVLEIPFSAIKTRFSFHLVASASRWLFDGTAASGALIVVGEDVRYGCPLAKMLFNALNLNIYRYFKEFRGRDCEDQA
jgi:hypothetical protein